MISSHHASRNFRVPANVSLLATARSLVGKTIDPIAGVNKLKDRLITIQMHDLNELTATGHDVPWGTGAGKTEQVLKEMHRLGIQPTMWGLEYSYNFTNSLPDVTECVGFFNKVSLEVSSGGSR